MKEDKSYSAFDAFADGADFEAARRRHELHQGSSGRVTYTDVDPYGVDGPTMDEVSDAMIRRSARAVSLEPTRLRTLSVV